MRNLIRVGLGVNFSVLVPGKEKSILVLYTPVSCAHGMSMTRTLPGVWSHILAEELTWRGLSVKILTIGDC